MEYSHDSIAREDSSMVTIIPKGNVTVHSNIRVIKGETVELGMPKKALLCNAVHFYNPNSL